jgi:hypothetical protein
VLAKAGAPWDDPGEEAEILKCCPYSSDAPRYGSWSEQAAVWERAASRSTRGGATPFSHVRLLRRLEPDRAMGAVILPTSSAAQYILIVQLLDPARR